MVLLNCLKNKYIILLNAQGSFCSFVIKFNKLFIPLINSNSSKHQITITNTKNKKAVII